MTPGNEWLKLNVDATVFSKLRSIGIGCALRNSIGEFILAMIVHIHQMQMTKVLVEMDSQVVLNALNRTSPFASSPFAMLIKDC